MFTVRERVRPRSRFSKKADRHQSAPLPLERLQKALANRGLGSRREIEDWIVQGRIQVNGVRAKLGLRVAGTERILIDGEPAKGSIAQDIKVVLYHKPVGEVSTRHDEQNRPTVFDALPPIRTGRWISVGRLDVNTSGLLLFTNNGELAHRLMHPQYGLDREYAVRVLGKVKAEALTALQSGVLLDGVSVRFHTVELKGGEGANCWYHVTVGEGRHREVRRLWETQGLQVSRLIRVRYGPVILPRRLWAGHWEALAAAETRALLKCVGLVLRRKAREPGRARSSLRSPRRLDH